jgi:AraC-like DNA-binding protein
MVLTTLASVAGMIVSTLEQRGIDGYRVLADAGLDPARLQDPNGRYPYAGMTRLWRRAVSVTGDECFGLVVSQRLNVASLHGLGFAWLASDTLVDAMQRVARYFKVATTATQLSVDRQSDRYSLRFDVFDKNEMPAAASMDYAAGVIVALCRLSIGENFRPLLVRLPHPSPGQACATQMIQTLRTQIVFDASNLVIDVGRDVADATLPFRNQELAHANEEVLIRYLAELDRNAIAARVKARLVDTLPAGAVSEKVMAESLHMSLRSLQRRLKNENTSYKALLDKTRHELAVRYLGTSGLSVTEVTYLLGFSDPSNFSRAFKRWRGMTPSAFIDQHHRNPPAVSKNG